MLKKLLFSTLGSTIGGQKSEQLAKPPNLPTLPTTIILHITLYTV
jgi:hypothetical protein